MTSSAPEVPPYLDRSIPAEALLQRLLRRACARPTAPPHALLLSQIARPRGVAPLVRVPADAMGKSGPGIWRATPSDGCASWRHPNVSKSIGAFAPVRCASPVEKR